MMRRLEGRLGVLGLLATLLVWIGCDGQNGEHCATRQWPTSTARPGGLDLSIRVLLDDELANCDIAVPGLFDLLDADQRTPLLENVSISRMTVRFGPGAIVFPELQQFFEMEAVEIVPHGEEPVSVAIGDDRREYRGTFTVCRDPDRSGAVVNTLDVEEYLISVVASEAPATFHPEALRAQAIVSRTYAWYQKRTAPEGRRWDLRATEASQVYSGVTSGPAWRRAAAAVEYTRGIVCTWMSPQGERIFCAYFSSTCGGHTQAAGPVKNEATIPPLAGGVKCAYCADASPAYKWNPVSFSKKAVTERLRAKYPKFKTIGQIEEIQVIDQTAQGRPVRLRLVDGKDRSIPLEAENFRLTVDPSGRSLRSTFFKVRSEPTRFVFSGGKGFGHGLGLCQYGANGMAEAGANVAYILSHYYPQSRLKRAY
jgi:stage II sporulation protein D